MFDLGFSEILMIGAVALVVLGPERMPAVARTAGHWFRKAQNVINEVKLDIDREADLAELKRLKNETASLVESTVSEVKSDVSEVKNEVSDLETAVKFSEKTEKPFSYDLLDSSVSTVDATDRDDDIRDLKRDIARLKFELSRKTHYVNRQDVLRLRSRSRQRVSRGRKSHE